MYNFKEIENKWQKIWDEKKVFCATDDYSKKKFYGLVEFPYPSGAGMHVGHIKAYAGLEVVSRKRRLEGYNVLFPMGFDAFGLPTENYAIKTNTHPRIVTDSNISNFTSQLKKVGFSFDWDRVIDTTDENYYKWTQWIFLKMFEHGLTFRDKTLVNYCPSCKVVLSNEDSQGGKCDICHSDIVQKEKDVWYLRITEYADKLLEGLEKVDYLPNIKLQQQNWIGKSTGAYVNFRVKEIGEKLKVYTTRPDTLYGVTFMVVAPEHPLIDKYSDKISNMNEILEYREKASKKSAFERTQLVKDKTGVKIDGFTAINPVNKKEIPIYISDYVMMGYGTGAIMAVPAHDDRDYDFAKKFDIPVIQVLEEVIGSKSEVEVEKKAVVAVLYDEENDKYLVNENVFVEAEVKNDENPVEIATARFAELGYENVSLINEGFKLNYHYSIDDGSFDVELIPLLFKVDSSKIEEVSEDTEDENEPDNKVENKAEEETNKGESEKEEVTPEEEDNGFVWLTKNEITKVLKEDSHVKVFEYLINPGAMCGDGTHINSDILNKLDKEAAINKIIEFLTNEKIGEKAVQFKMQDWAFNRQRYWGEPIPIVHCEYCGDVAVPYEELPLRLPDVENFEPGTDGESPLAKIDSYVKCKCPKCGKDARRETDTMPQWAGSSWYFLRYIDPHNDNEFASMEKLKYWMNVDWYNGGMEHVTRHVIYSRFWYKFLYDIGVVPTDEPYMKRTAQGLVLGPDGEKMSKSRGNVVNPNDTVEEYGADTLRTYVLFMGDYGLESPWNDNSIKGVSRFLDKVYSLKDKVVDGNKYSSDLEVMIHKTIKKVSDDYEAMKFNTGIAELMKLVNTFSDRKEITKADYTTLLILLNPSAPHITEELNEMIGNSPIYESSWPVYDEDKLVESEKEIAVQVNGKVRATIKVNVNDSEEEIREKALAEDNVIKHTEGMTIVKVIVIKGKIVNIVVK